LICGLKDRQVSRLIKEVKRPVRYSGNEIHLAGSQDGKLGILLCFPDLYDIGMSNLGIRILYHILNRHPDFWVDLAFAPWVDMEAFMRAGRLPLAGLGTCAPARNFSILGFSLQHELQYANVLTMLDLAGIPVRAADRSADDPIVVAGGPCAFNPEPMADFIDAFAVGDGEAVCVEIASAVLKAKGKGGTRFEVLERLTDVAGVYVPRVCEPPSSGEVVRRRVEPQLREEDFPLPPIVPIAPITHDRLTIEIMRGCTRGCRFCSAGMLGRPVRERSASSVVRLAERGIAESGWEEVSLVSLSTSDHSGLEAMVSGLTRTLGERHVSISLPSMRPGTFSENIAHLIAGTKKTGLTFAPEAGTDRLRKSINKDVDENELYATVETAFRNGWDAVKLYFMVGLPTETDEDADAMIRMVRSVESICRVYGRRRHITVALSPFVPRPHTPFQWAAQQRPEETLRRISYIRKSLPDRRIKLKWRDPFMAHLEGLLARGDRRIGNVILRAWGEGARFDSWTDRFDYGRWIDAFQTEGLSIDQGFTPRDTDSSLAWDHIDGGVSKDFLRVEARRATAAEVTPDCRSGQCTDCGACPGPAGAAAASHEGSVSKYMRPRMRAGTPADVEIRYRVRFAKLEDMGLASHLDMVRSIQRGLRRAGVPLRYSKGFSPHPRMSFGPPLPLGVLGEGEYLDVFFWRQPDDGWVDKVNEYLPGGLRLLEARIVGRHGPSLMKIVNVARYTVIAFRDVAGGPDNLVERLKARFPEDTEILAMDSGPDDDRISVKVEANLRPGAGRPEKVLAEVLKEAGVCYRITREGLYNESNGVLRTPFDIGV
jgi:radical SAM family uncharacterized protein